MVKLTANSPIRHDGEDVEEGATFDVAKKRQADALIASGAARKPGSAGPDDGPKGDPEAMTGVTGDPDTKQAAPVPTTPGDAADESAKKASAKA